MIKRPLHIGQAELHKLLPPDLHEPTSQLFIFCVLIILAVTVIVLAVAYFRVG